MNVDRSIFLLYSLLIIIDLLPWCVKSVQQKKSRYSKVRVDKNYNYFNKPNTKIIIMMNDYYNLQHGNI